MNKDCFAFMEKGCSILNKFICRNGECPFYKTKKQYAEEQAKYPHVDSRNYRKVEIK